MKVSGQFLVNLGGKKDQELIEKLRAVLEKKLNEVVPGIHLSNADLVRMCIRKELERLEE